MLDLCCAIVGEDEKGYISSILERIATRVPAPILVDSTEADVVEEALKRIPGRAIINSINLEDGEKRTSLVLPMAKRYGAAVIALTIDEDGMALTAEKEDGDRAPDFRSGDEEVWAGRNGSDFRCADPADFDRAGGVPERGDRDAEGGGADQERAARRKDDSGREQYFVWAGCVSAAGVEFGVHARGGGPWAGYGHRELHEDLSAVQDSAGRSGSGAEADFPRRVGWRSAAEIHEPLRRAEGQAGGFDDGACGYACRWKTS
jgi:hypothetical protein